MTFTGRVTFTSSRSIEIEVLVDAEDFREGIIITTYLSDFFSFCARSALSHLYGPPE